MNVKQFLSANWVDRINRPDVPEFRRRAIECGYLYRAVPRAFGGSEQPPDMIKARIIAEEFGSAKAPIEVKGVGAQMLAPTLLECGEPWQKERFVRAALFGEERWCQGYSEPGAGSDLASLRTSGVLRDGKWVINGQKVWTSYAKHAHFMFALIRTEPQAPKRQGLSYLLIDMNQPGIDIRPLKQINGGEEFNEVFFSDATTPSDWIVGERGKGWSVSKSLLKHERNMLGGIDRSEALFASLLALAKRVTRHGKPAIVDPLVRDRLAALRAELEVQRHSIHIQLTRELGGEGAPRLQSMNKLAQSNYAADVAGLAMQIIGDTGLLSPVGIDRPGNERWLNQYMNSLAAAIAGGTSNIQRNIIAERVLGLPRDGASA